jgi:hypothetical protein
VKKLTNYFTKKDILFKQLNSIDLKELNSRKKLSLYDALDINKAYYAIFIVDAKSRFLRKNVQELEGLLLKLIELKDHNYKKKILLISSPLCSLAKQELKQNGWSVYIDFM